MEGDFKAVNNTPDAEPAPKVKEPLPEADKYIWAIYIALIVISVIELYSASSREVMADNVFSPIIRHGRMLAIGVGITWIISRVRYKTFKLITPIFAVLTVALAFYVLFKGDIINGARRSTTILGIPIQPAELLKLSVVLVIAGVMSVNQIRQGVTSRAVLICAAFVLLCGALLYSQGLTNTLLLMGISFVMMLIGGVQWKKFGVVLLVYACVGGVALMYKSITAEEMTEAERQHITETGRNLQGEVETIDRTSTQKNRIARWLNLGDTVPKYAQRITSENAQEQYSFMAQANGGWIGQLPGNSRETARLPLAFSDYIFAIVVEDWGFAGGVSLLIIYLMLMMRAGAIASRCSRAFPALLVLGMAVLVTLQALFHMAIVTGVFPVSGQPLPLISKGGSSIIATSIAFGIMLSVSRFAVQNGTRREENEELKQLPENLSAANPTKL